MERSARTMWAVAAMLASAGAAAAQLASGVITMREGAVPPALLVRELTADGVVLVAGESETAQTQLITWDRIASVQGAWREQAAPYREMATDLWRGRVRLERGDTLGAEPLFEKHVARFEGRTGPLAAMFWSGVLRCRVSRQAQSSAIVAWSGLLRAGQDEVIFASRSRAGDSSRDTAIIDAATGLAPQLAPIYLPSPSLQIVAQSGPGEMLTRADRLMQLYVLAAEFEMGRAVTLPARDDADAALALTWDVVAARAGDDVAKAAAKKNLQARLKSEDPPRWQEAWVRVALGRLMLASGDGEERHLGMAMLLHVPARLADAHPYLAGVALAEVSAQLAREGNKTGARAVVAKLEAEFPGHPALRWEGLRAVRSAESAAGGAP